MLLLAPDNNQLFKMLYVLAVSNETPRAERWPDLHNTAVHMQLPPRRPRSPGAHQTCLMVGQGAIPAPGAQLGQGRGLGCASPQHPQSWVWGAARVRSVAGGCLTPFTVDILYPKAKAPAKGELGGEWGEARALRALRSGYLPLL